ncbi:hypothetical protein [Pectinatus frisingensis]|jgi:DNA-directed RNA polymerase subunit RPC12/RpoP|nr:hypothetical protein [Pectinatus frisingensis]
MKIKCANCGKLFEKDRENAKYCCPDCHEEANYKKRCKAKRIKRGL